MDILYLLDRLETVLTSGSRVPFTGKTVVDEHECLDIIDQLRVAVPDEVKQAKRLHGDRDRIIQEAEERASRIVAHAQEQASNLADQHEIAKAAESVARRTMAAAEADAAEAREGADRYASETLAELEHRLDEMMGVVRNGLRSLDSGHSAGGYREEYGDEAGRPG